MKKTKKVEKAKLQEKDWKMSVSSVEKSGCLVNSD